MRLRDRHGGKVEQGQEMLNFGSNIQTICEKMLRSVINGPIHVKTKSPSPTAQAHITGRRTSRAGAHHTHTGAHHVQAYITRTGVHHAHRCTSHAGVHHTHTGAHHTHRHTSRTGILLPRFQVFWVQWILFNFTIATGEPETGRLGVLGQPRNLIRFQLKTQHKAKSVC